MASLSVCLSVCIAIKIVSKMHKMSLLPGAALNLMMLLFDLGRCPGNGDAPFSGCERVKHHNDWFIEP
jgi:hypothetical protein